MKSLGRALKKQSVHILYLHLLLLFIGCGHLAKNQIKNRPSNTNSHSIKITPTKKPLFIWYDISNGHPGKLYEHGVFILGHVAGKNIDKEISEKYPDIVVKNITNLGAHEVHEFINNNSGKPILFTGDTNLEIPDGFKWIALESLGEILKGPGDSETKIVKINNMENSQDLYPGYLKMNPSEIMDSINISLSNILQKQKFPKAKVIWINGPSGSGKSTLLKKLNNEHYKAVDVDYVYDNVERKLLKTEGHPTSIDKFVRKVESQVQDIAFKMISEADKYIIFVGLPINLEGLADYKYAIDLDPQEIFIRKTKRHLKAICDNREEIKRTLDSKDLKKDMWALELRHEIRGKIIGNVEMGIKSIEDKIKKLKTDGFKLMSANDIEKELKTIIEAVH